MQSKYFAISFLIGLITIITTISCSKTFSSVEELQKYILDQSNGLIAIKEEKEIIIKVIYRPTDLLIARELKSKKLEDLKLKYEKNLYFILSYSKAGHDILKSGVTSQTDYGNKLNVLSYNMNQYVRLISGKDTIPVKDYIYQNMFGTSHSTELLFAFSKDQIKKAKTIEFVLEDIGFGIGKKIFEFQYSDIENIPHLKLKEEFNN